MDEPKPYIQRLKDQIKELELKLKNKTKGNNSQLLNLFSKRMELGNMTFGKQVPLDGTYSLKDALEEALDLSIYVGGVVLETYKATLFNKLVVDEIMEHFNAQSIDKEEQVLTGNNFDDICGKVQKSLHSKECAGLL
jgi:hypothetical protein|tara:strand:+ start:139 stop:549 length:411 start_codon:yes stop_codon:yes gene_type:complete